MGGAVITIKQFFQKASPRELKKAILLAVIAGCANALLIVIINRVAFLVAEGLRPSWIEAITFVGIFIVYYICNRYALLGANKLIENLLKHIRIDIANKIRHSELETINQISRGKLYSLLAYETNHLSVSFPILIDNFQQLILLIVALIYLGYLSKAALIVFLLSALAGGYIYKNINRRFGGIMRECARQQQKILDFYSAIIYGSKEIRLHQKRSEGVLEGFIQESKKYQNFLGTSGTMWTQLVLLNAFIMYLMIGTVAFIFPQYIDGHSTVIFQLVPTLLFCFGPLSKIVAHLPLFIRAHIGLSNIFQIEDQFDKSSKATIKPARNKTNKYCDFESLSYKRVTYHYKSQHKKLLFTSGPWDLDVKRGELIFLVGGNGSGKSTALRLIAGLYHWESGQLTIDGVRVQESDMAGVRELFSSVFSDFHLFDRLYGLEHVDPLKVEALLDQMDLSHKVRYEKGSFTTTRLSTGQRKRLALITAILEDRPIILLDEWAAEQDKYFREIFYTKILPDLKATGKTVIVVNHDDRYWHIADRIVTFDLGKIQLDNNCESTSEN